MNLKFVNPGIEYMLESIMHFQTDDTTSFWSDGLYNLYPILDKGYAYKLTFKERKEYLTKMLTEQYYELESNINDKIEDYSLYWNKYKTQVEQALSDAFNIDCSSLFNDMVCRISMNPVSPRFLQEKTFEVFYLNSERGALGVSLHEIIHFVWFYVWHKTFDDDYDEYETPSLKWILSEMVVEAIMSDERLSSINPYYPREDGGCIYPYFYDMKINNKLILECLDEMYKTKNIQEFMKDSYNLCLQHEQEIREHIEKSENMI